MINEPEYDDAYLHLYYFCLKQMCELEEEPKTISNRNR